MLDSRPVNCGSRRIPYALEGKVSDMISQMLENNIICHSCSAFSAPIVIVPKKKSNIRICIDYRKLNQATKQLIFHIPSAQEIFGNLGGNSYFTTLDLSKGYVLPNMVGRKGCA